MNVHAVHEYICIDLHILIIATCVESWFLLVTWFISRCICCIIYHLLAFCRLMLVDALIFQAQLVILWSTCNFFKPLCHNDILILSYDKLLLNYGLSFSLLRSSVDVLTSVYQIIIIIIIIYLLNQHQTVMYSNAI